MLRNACGFREAQSCREILENRDRVERRQRRPQQKLHWQQQQSQQGQQRLALEENMTGPSKQRKLRSPHSYLDTFLGGEFVVVDQLL